MGDFRRFVPSSARVELCDWLSLALQSISFLLMAGGTRQHATPSFVLLCLNRHTWPSYGSGWHKRLLIYNKTNQMHQFHKFVMKLYMFRTVRLSIISSLFTVHSAMVYVITVCRQLSSRTRMELSSILVLLLVSVQWINWWADELSETCRVSWQICEISASSWFYYKEICYDALSHEREKADTL